MSKLDVTKKHYSKLKAMSKITKIPSEIRNFFSEKRRSTTALSFKKAWLIKNSIYGDVIIDLLFIPITFMV